MIRSRFWPWMTGFSSATSQTLPFRERLGAPGIPVVREDATDTHHQQLDHRRSHEGRLTLGNESPDQHGSNHYGEHDPVGDEDVPQWPGHVPKPGDGPSPPGPPADEGTDGRRTYQSHRHAEPAGSYAPAGDGETARQAQPDVIPPRNLRHGVADVCRQTILSGLVEGSDRICHC